MSKTFKHFKDSNGTDTTINAAQVRFAQPATDETTTLYFGNGAAVLVKEPFASVSTWLLGID
jgi:hypothetical protein